MKARYPLILLAGSTSRMAATTSPVDELGRLPAQVVLLYRHLVGGIVRKTRIRLFVYPIGLLKMVT